MPKFGRRLHLMIGESGSGKTTYARNLVESSKGTMVRINRDDLRLMVHNNQNKGSNMEEYISSLERTAALIAIEDGLNVVVDNTHLNIKTQERWAKLAEYAGVELVIERMQTSLEECIQRDRHRTGSAHVGDAVIYRQFLDSGRLPINKYRPIVIVDVDGTLAHNDGHRSYYDESKVLDDKPHEPIVMWVRELAKESTIIIVSGRHSTCGDDTIAWLNIHGVPYDFVLMKHAWDNRTDVTVKSEILSALLRLVHKEQIVLSIDDRPCVVEHVWRKNGIKCIPVAGQCEDF